MGLSENLFLRDVDWQSYYSHEDGNLVSLFYEPALSRSILYQRITGYFSADVFSLVARGLNGLIHSGGQMQLIVGCTLGERELQQIEEGYDLRELVSKGLAEKLGLTLDDELARERLGWLAWMIANGHLDIRVAVPKNDKGGFQKGLGLYHAKSGFLRDRAGDRLAFTGSINETQAGWIHNWESFAVHCSWRGEHDTAAIDKLEALFSLLWANTAKTAEVMTVSDAVKAKLLDHLPANDVPIPPPQIIPVPEPELSPEKETEPPPPQEPELPEKVQEEQESYRVSPMDPEERRRRVWAFIENAPRRDDGALVAVETSAVKPWPHQLKAYKRMLDNWPFRLLLADEVGLGKTIEAGLIIRHLWISGLAKRILILVPAGVLPQWQGELYEKFNLLVPIYTGKSLNWPDYHFRQHPIVEPISRDEWTQRPIILASSHLMRRKDRREELIEAEDWDLLIIDEAHHARRRGAGTTQEKGPNRLLGLLHRIEHKAKSLLLMTATPMQVHPVEIYDLLRILGIPETWNEGAFLNYFDWLGGNPDEDRLHALAKLFQSIEAEYGPVSESDVRRIGERVDLPDLSMKKVLRALRDPKTNIPIKRLNAKQRRAAMAVLKAGSPIRHRMSRYTRNLLREYYKKGLLDSPIAERTVNDIPIDLTPPERALYEAVEA